MSIEQKLPIARSHTRSSTQNANAELLHARLQRGYADSDSGQTA
jgi:hypothetical protein